MNSLLPILLADQGAIRIYEVRGELCMSAEDLGQCLGYADPQDSMDKLYQRNKEELADYRFSYKIDAETEERFSPQSGGKTSKDAERFSGQSDRKTSTKNVGGRPSIFYSEMGIYTVAMLSNTETAKAFRKRVAGLLKTIRLQQKLEMAEKYISVVEEQKALIEKHKRKPPLSQAEREKIRELDAQGVQVSEIATMTGRSKASVSNFLRFGNTSGRIATPATK